MMKPITIKQQENIPKKWLFYSFTSAILVASVSGAQYIYPIYGTSLIHQFHWSSLENSIAGTSTFVGAVLSGPLCALFVEKFKFKKTLIIASLTALTSLSLLSQTYAGYLSTHFMLCSIYLAMTGFAGAAAYLCALDSQAHNFKTHKGMSMGITSAALGVSGLLFSQLNDRFFSSENDTTIQFLMVYGSCFFTVTFIASFILGPIDPIQYENEDHIKFINHSTNKYTQSLCSYSTSSTQYEEEDEEQPLLSKNKVCSADNILLLHQQVSGWDFFTDPVGYSLVVSLMVMTGVGYVYLANLGQLLTSLARPLNSDQVASLGEAQHVRNFHVALFSLVNCGSRILFGALSDVCQKKLGLHRLWFLWMSAVGLVTTLLYLTTMVSTAKQLIPCTVMTAAIYGLVFSLSPAIVSEFGDKTFARNWGWLMWAPAMGGQLFNVLFGIVYDRESKHQGNMETTCYGPACYELTFYLGALFAFICLFVLSITIYKKRLYRKQSNLLN